MKIRIIGRKSNPFSKGLFSFDEGGIGNSTKRGYGANFGNLITRFDVGGSHKSNPHEGIRVGLDSDGNPNLVEEGEIIWNGLKRVNGELIDNPYVFSNRLMAPSSIIKGVSGSSHKRNLELSKHINKTIKVKRGSGGDLGVPGDDKLVERLNSEPTEEEMRENFFAYLELKGVSDKDKQLLMYEEMMNLKNGNAEGGIPDEDLEFINDYLSLELEQELEEPAEEGEEKELEKENPEDKDLLLDDRISELELLILELLQALMLYQLLELGAEQLEAPIEELQLIQGLELLEGGELDFPSYEEAANMAAEGDVFDDGSEYEEELENDSEAKMFNDIKLVVDSEYNNTGTVSDDTIYNIEKVLKLNNVSMKSLLKILRYILYLRLGLQLALQLEGYFKLGGTIKDGYNRLSSAGKALFRMILNSKGNPDLREAILQLYNKLPIDDLKILMPILLNLAANGGVLFDEGSEMELELLLQLMMLELLALLDLMLNGEVLQLDLEILALILEILLLVLENPEMQLDLNTMALLGLQVKELAQGLSPQGLLLLQQMMQEFALALQLQLELMQLLQLLQLEQHGAQQGLQGTGDPNIDRVRLDIPTAAQLLLMDLLQLMLLQLQQLMQLQLMMSEGGNLYPEGGLPLISQLDQQIFALIQLLALQQTPEALLLILQLALLLSPQGQQYLLLMMQLSLGLQGLQLLLNLDEVINQILDLAFEKLRENGKEPERYDKNEKGGKSYADVVKDISKEYEERPNDPISKRTLESLMLDLADSLEETRAMKHKELLDNAFSNMNTLELDEFKLDIAQLILEAFGLNGLQLLTLEANLEQQQEQTPPQESELQVQLSPEEKLMVDEVIQQQGIDPNSLSLEEYMQAAQLILLSILEQQQLEQPAPELEPSMQDLLAQLGMSANGGVFAEGGVANKFAKAGPVDNKKKPLPGLPLTIELLLEARNKSLEGKYKSNIDKLNENNNNKKVYDAIVAKIKLTPEYKAYHTNPELFFNKYHCRPLTLCKLIADDILNDKHPKFNDKVKYQKYFDNIKSNDGNIIVTDDDLKGLKLENLMKLYVERGGGKFLEYTMPETVKYDGPKEVKPDNTRDILHHIDPTSTGGGNGSLYNISSVYELLGIDPVRNKRLIVSDLNKIFGKGKWDNLDNGITESQVDKLRDYYMTTNKSSLGKLILKSYGNTDLNNYSGLSRSLKDVQPGDLYVSQDGKLLFVKGEDGKGYAITDSKGNIKTDGFRKAGISADDTADTLALLKNNMYTTSDALRNYKGVGNRNMTRLNYLNNLDNELTMTDGKFNHVPSIFKEDRYKIDENGNITFKNNVAATDLDKLFKLFGNPVKEVEDDGRPERFKGDDIDGAKQSEFAKLYREKLLKFFNSDKYKAGDKGKIINDKTLGSLYLTGAEARQWINELELGDYDEKFLAKVLKANWGDDKTDWSDKGAWEFNSSNDKFKTGRLRHSPILSKTKPITGVKESEAYLLLVAKSVGIKDPEKMSHDELVKALKEYNGDENTKRRIRLLMDSLWGIEHVPYLAALKNKNKYKMYEIVGDDGKGTGEYIQTDKLPDGYETVNDYKSEKVIKNPNDKGDHTVLIVGVKPSLEAVLVYHNGKLYQTTKKDAEDNGLELMPKEELDKLEFNKPTDSVGRKYTIYRANSNVEEKKKEKEKEKETEETPFKTSFIPNAPAIAGAFWALGSGPHHYGMNVYKPEVYTATATPHTDYMEFTPTDYLNIDSKSYASMTNTSNLLSNLSSGNQGLASALIANNTLSAINAMGDNREKLIKADLDRYNAIKSGNFNQDHSNDLMLALVSMNNALAYNNGALKYTDALNSRERDMANMRYRTDADHDASQAEAMKTLANTWTDYLKYREYKNQVDWMQKNGYLGEYLTGKKTGAALGGYIVRPRRGWSFF